MAGFTRGEVARRAGVPDEFVDRLIDFGIVSTCDDRGSFTDGDARRARFVRDLEQGGVPLESIVSAVRSGALSLAFFDAPYWDRFGGLSAKTYSEVSAETGLSLDLLQTTRESMGYARPGSEDRVREGEAAAVDLLKTLVAGGADPAALERHVRAWGESFRRIADADGTFFHTQVQVPLLAAGLSQTQMLEAASEMADAIGPLLNPALLSFYNAQSEHTWLANVVEAVETALEEAGLHRSGSRPPAMCFLDLSGYTRLTEERGDEAAAEMSATLGGLVQRTSHEHGGRPVKWLGDGVMVFFRDPGAAVRFALDMRDALPKADLPPAHTGIAAGR
jgi:adenylate cyclase